MSVNYGVEKIFSSSRVEFVRAAGSSAEDREKAPFAFLVVYFLFLSRNYFFRRLYSAHGVMDSNDRDFINAQRLNEKFVLL